MEENQPKLKAGMKTWNAAVAAHASGRYSDALGLYGELSNISGRIYYNMSCAYEKLGDVDNALKCLTNAVENDIYLAIAYFQRGSLFLLQKRTKEAIPDIEKARMLMRGNIQINYKPLGLLGCMYSYQVLHNLALARMYESNMVDARQLLVEALHDADNTQRQMIKKTAEYLQSGDVDRIKPLLVPTDRVFRPPKSITKNLVKKSLMQKARVVSAADATDMRSSFGGVRRVEEMKQLPDKKPPRGPFFTMGRFVKNAKPRDRRYSDITDTTPQRPVKSSKSMEDIRNLEQLSEHGANANVKSGDRNVLNLSISHSVSANNLEQLPEPRISPTETKESKSPRGPLKRMKKLLKPKPKCRTSAPVLDGVEPVVVMRGCGSTGDLRELWYEEEEPVMATFASIKAMSNNAINENRSNPGTEHRKSLGSLFVNSLTVTGQALSASCDVLTSVVTPPETGCDVTDSNNTELSSDSDRPSSPEENYNEIERPSSVEFRIEMDLDRNTSFVRRIEFTVPKKDDMSGNSPTTTVDDDVTSSVTYTNTSGNKDTTADASKTTKARPPPPSYPPPLLPQLIVDEA